MAKKQTVSFGIDQPELDAIMESVKAIQEDGAEMDFSKWMRDAVRQKLRRSRRINDDEPRYRIQTEALVITDPDGRVTKINREFAEMCGYALKELRGKKPGDVLQGPATEKDVVRDFRKAIRAVRPFTCTISNYHKSGALYHVRIEMRPLFEGAKHVGFEAVERRLD
jgi:PAS domain S-box-containing protein